MLAHEVATKAAFAGALAYGGVAQMLAGMWEFGNVFGATAFTSYGASRLVFWVYVAFTRKGYRPRAKGRQSAGF